MFDQLKNMAGMASLMKDLPKFQEKAKEVQQRLAEIKVEADTGGGAVRVIVNGQLQVLHIHVDPAMLDGLVTAGNPDDRALAEDLITGAVNSALVKAREAAQQEISQAAQDMGLPIPSGALGNLLG